MFDDENDSPDLEIIEVKKNYIEPEKIQNSINDIEKPIQSTEQEK